MFNKRNKKNEFEACFKFSSELVDLFADEEELQIRDTNLLFRAYHYLLTSAYNIGDAERHEIYLAELENFRKSNYNNFNENTKIISFMYVHLGRLNQHFLNKTFDEGIELIQQRTLRRLERYKHKIDEHKVMIFYYKIAWMYIGNKMPGKSIPYLQEIINQSNKSLRSDIQAYARILFLIAHTDLGNDFIMPSMITNFKRYFSKNNIDHQAQFKFLNFFRKYYKANPDERQTLIKKYLLEFKQLNKSKFEKRAFLYLDIIPWMEAKLEGKAVGELV